MKTLCFALFALLFPLIVNATQDPCDLDGEDCLFLETNIDTAYNANNYALAERYLKIYDATNCADMDVHEYR